MRPALTGQTILISRSEETDRIAQTLSLMAKEGDTQYETLDHRHEVEMGQLQDQFSALDDQLCAGHAARTELLDRISNTSGLAAAIGIAMASANGVSRSQFEQEVKLLHMVEEDAEERLKSRQKQEVDALRSRQKAEYAAQVSAMLAEVGMTTDFDPCQLLLRSAPTAEHWIMDIARVDQAGEVIMEPEDIFEAMMSGVVSPEHGMPIGTVVGDVHAGHDFGVVNVTVTPEPDAPDMPEDADRREGVWDGFTDDVDPASR